MRIDGKFKLGDLGIERRTVAFQNDTTVDGVVTYEAFTDLGSLLVDGFAGNPAYPSITS
jgi:hypothetical protein